MNMLYHNAFMLATLPFIDDHNLCVRETSAHK